MAKKGGLGAGLSALFAEELAEVEESQKNTMTVPIEKVEPREAQPRKIFDEESLAELTESIRRYGIIQPITVRPWDHGYYQIIAGERRWRAAREAGLEEVPVRIIEADDRTVTELALVENLQREDLNPIEEALGYKTLITEYGLTQEEASAIVGRSRPTVTNALRLLQLSPQVQKLVEEGEISSGHARTLIPVTDTDKQLDLALQVIEKQLSVRQTETLVKRILEKKPDPPEPEKNEITVDYTREIEKELENALGRKIKLVDGKKKGRIEIEFYGAEDREKLIENLRLFSSLRNTRS